jgi:tetratricopeptide (TPR) repeat protein/peroxiredoxin
MRLRYLATCLAVLGMALLPTGAVTQESRSPTTARVLDARSAIARLRMLYLQWDYEGGYFEGRDLVGRYPGSPELRAWFIANMAANGMEDDAARAADSLARAYPKSPWGSFARALALTPESGRRREALPLVQQARKAAPWQRDLVWLHATVWTDLEEYDKAIALVDSAVSRDRPSAELLAVKGRALGTRGLRRGVATGLDDAHAAWQEALQLDSLNLQALIYTAQVLGWRGKQDEANALFQRALAISPFSTQVHELFWLAVQKPDVIRADSDALLRARGDYPGTLLTVAGQFRQLDLPEQQRRLEEKLLSRFPQSVEAERLLMGRIARLQDSIHKKEVADTAKARADVRRMLAQFVARPVHRNSRLLSQAYVNLFEEVKLDTTVAVAELREIVDGMIRHTPRRPEVTHVNVPIALAQRGVELALAERLAREAPARIRSMMQSQKDAYGSLGEHASALDRGLSAAHDALGWVFFHQGRLDDAEKELRRADELRRNSPSVRFHLGRLAEARGHRETAEEMYASGYTAERGGAGPNQAALRDLYKGQRGSLDGFDIYVAQVRERASAKWKQEVLAKRIADPKPVPSFRLARMEGGRLSSESLMGKVVVINFWGVWCGPCVAEAPDLQKLHEKYRSDPDVVFLTINNDPDPETARRWMKEKKFEYSVLLDDGYVIPRAGVSRFPTSWFLDREGRLVFEHKGASQDLIEEFSWRVESLRGTGTSAFR